jgi:uncharacterized membrane protein
MGLNVNATAVIFDDMIICPYMKPIIGFDLGVGINDFDFIKKSKL